jgi:hypothetical protein
LKCDPIEMRVTDDNMVGRPVPQLAVRPSQSRRAWFHALPAGARF